MIRAFISIDLPREVREEIKKIQDSLPEFRGKKTELENLHLTLKFLGEINKEKIIEIKRKLKEIDFNIFEAEINSIGVFSEKFIRIVWLYLDNCRDLQGEIDNKLKDLFEPEFRFMSHLTIARVKNIKNKKNFLKFEERNSLGFSTSKKINSVENKKKFLEELNNIKIQKIKFIVDKFLLKQSILKPRGPEYKILESFNLN